MSHSEDRLDAIVDGEWWRDLAACKGTDAELFFDKKHKQKALAFCRSCQVNNCCLDYALNFEREWGIWGGFTATQRTRYRPELRAYVEKKLGQGRWGSVAVGGSHDALDEAEYSSSPGQSSALAARQVNDDEGRQEGLNEGK